MQDIEALINAGVFSILLEAIPNQVTEMITKNFDIAFFGIGAGIHVDGQLVISSDMLGNFVGDIDPKFVKKYLNLQESIIELSKNIKKILRTYHFHLTNTFTILTKNL